MKESEARDNNQELSCRPSVVMSYQYDLEDHKSNRVAQR